MWPVTYYKSNITCNHQQSNTTNIKHNNYIYVYVTNEYSTSHGSCTGGLTAALDHILHICKSGVLFKDSVA